MKIVVIGTRGIPYLLGGVETHCEELYPRIVNLGYSVVVIRRSCYIKDSLTKHEYKGVQLKDIYCPHSKLLEATFHTFISIIYARFIKTDILHIHAIGPSILVPFARLLGLKVVVTHHGPDYLRQKWGCIAKTMLKLGERMAAIYSNELIVISNVIYKSLEKFKRSQKPHIIFNGVNIPIKATNDNYIQSLGLTKGKYIIALGRFVEEKGFDYLIKAFIDSNLKDYKLVIAGDADHNSLYANELKKTAIQNGVILTGFIKGDKLNELMTYAGLFVLPSFHEGLPISLLEAMSYSLNILASNISPNLQLNLPNDSYFEVGNVFDLKTKLISKTKLINKSTNYDLTPYNWDNIANQVTEVYRKLK